MNTTLRLAAISCLLVLCACGENRPSRPAPEIGAPANVAPEKTRETKLVILTYRIDGDFIKAAEMARLQKIIDEGGWQVAETETVGRGDSTWFVTTVILERWR